MGLSKVMGRIANLDKRFEDLAKSIKMPLAEKPSSTGERSPIRKLFGDYQYLVALPQDFN